MCAQAFIKLIIIIFYTNASAIYNIASVTHHFIDYITQLTVTDINWLTTLVA